MISEKANVKGSGKKSNNWIPLDSCDIYYDHSTYVDCEHSITLSFKNQMNPIDSRITVEITPESAKDMMDKIKIALEKGNYIP
tara:strand:- start:6160 stop:6408 length:249 start_codon:yes stop_codon:yes gene_type:complete